MLNIFSKKPPHFFSADEQNEIVAAIQKAEKETSGEIRLYVESHCTYVDAIDRTKEIFAKLKMHQTQQRNAVLIYLAMKDKQLAVYGDEGIHQHVGETFWQQEVQTLTTHFNLNNFTQGIIQVVSEIGDTLSKAFPYNALTDIDELPDDIVYGK